MAYKILTKNGIDNSNIDGARGEYFNSGMRDGIVQGALNEGLFTATASNIISLDTCELRIAGHRIVIDEPVYHTFTNAPSSDTRYAFVAQIVVDDNQNVDFSLFVQTASTQLIQNDLYKNITGAGTYQVEIGRFTLLTTLTIEDVVRTIDIITGGTGGGSGSEINIGTVTTQTLDSDADAEVDVSSRYEEDEGKEYLDFTFGIPKAEVNVDTELSTTSENAVQNKVITNALNEKLGNNGEQILNGTLEVTTETFDEPSVTVDKSVTVNNSGNNTSKTTTNIAQINTNGLAIGQVEETTTSSGSDTVTKEIQYGLSGIKLNNSNIVDIDDNGVFNFSNKPTVSNESGVSEELVSESQVVRTNISQSLTDAQKQQAQTNITHTATQNHATSGVQVGWYQVANLKTNGNYDIKIKQSYNYNLPEAIHLSISINNRLYTGSPFASITQLSGVNPGAFSLSKIRVRQGTDEGTTFLDVYNPDQLWNTTWVDITSDSRDVVVEPNSPFQFIGTEDNPSGYKISSLDLVTGLNVNSTVTISGTVSDLNTISQPVNSTVTYTFSGDCANAPITDSGVVIQYQESTAYRTQLVIANDENVSTWRRSYRDGTWTEWTKVGTFLRYEYNKAISFGESGYLYIGKFPIYDTNITVDISSTTSTTYSGKLVIACQNYAVLKASVFGDYSNTVTPNIYYKKVDNTVEIYFKPTAWSKNVIHITGCGIRGEVTHVCENISAIPTDATSHPENEYVESGQTGAGQTELIYDMDSTDASINHGFTSGMKGGDYIDQDYSQYRKVRIYARLYNANCVQEVAVKNRKYADITLNAASPTPTVFSFLKLQMSLEPYLNRLQVMAYARYAFSTSSGTFTLDFGLTSETFYVYRIEGIK